MVLKPAIHWLYNEGVVVSILLRNFSSGLWSFQGRWLAFADTILDGGFLIAGRGHFLTFCNIFKKKFVSKFSQAQKVLPQTWGLKCAMLISVPNKRVTSVKSHAIKKSCLSLPKRGGACSRWKVSCARNSLHSSLKLERSVTYVVHLCPVKTDLTRRNCKRWVLIFYWATIRWSRAFQFTITTRRLISFHFGLIKHRKVKENLSSLGSRTGFNNWFNFEWKLWSNKPFAKYTCSFFIHSVRTTSL